MALLLDPVGELGDLVVDRPALGHELADEGGVVDDQHAVGGTRDALRRAVEMEHRFVATYTPDPQERAGLIDRANAVRPWSWT